MYCFDRSLFSEININSENYIQVLKKVVFRNLKTILVTIPNYSSGNMMMPRHISGVQIEVHEFLNFKVDDPFINFESSSTLVVSSWYNQVTCMLARFNAMWFFTVGNSKEINVFWQVTKPERTESSIESALDFVSDDKILLLKIHKSVISRCIKYIENYSKYFEHLR